MLMLQKLRFTLTNPSQWKQQDSIKNDKFKTREDILGRHTGKAAAVPPRELQFILISSI